MISVPSHLFASPSSRAADRAVYLLALVLLQAALLAEVAPRVAAALAPLAHLALPGGGFAVAQAAAYAVTLAGAAIVLAFPALAFARHIRRGRRRFLGLPRICVRTCAAGAAIAAAAQPLALLVRWHPGGLDPALAGIAASMAAGGVALAAAGALSAELLRRSVAPVRVPLAPWHCRAVRVEVIDPPELATHAG